MYTSTFVPFPSISTSVNLIICGAILKKWTKNRVIYYNKINIKKGVVNMSNPKYDDEFKKSIVALYQSGKSQSQISKEYGVSLSAISRWIKLYSEVKIDDDTILSAKQIKELQKRNAQLEEENLILKKAIAIFTPHSNRD